MTTSTQLDPLPEIPGHELLRVIGAGGSGEVWLARNLVGTLRAVKIIRPNRFGGERACERELEGIRRFEPLSRQHEALMNVLHVGRHEATGCFYAVMELADNANAVCGVRNVESSPVGSSHSALRTPHSYAPRTLRAEIAVRGRLPIFECVELGQRLAGGMTFLHEHGLVHRDIKPANVIFCRGQPKLADIGLVTGADEARSLVGTEGYIPPEGPGRQAADIYSLGKVLYEMASGRHRLEFPAAPAGFADAAEQNAFAELNEIILKACAEETKDRYQSAGQLRRELLLLQAGRSVTRLHRSERRLATLGKIGIVAGLLVLAGAGALVMEHRAAAAARVEQLAAEQRAADEAQRRQSIAASEQVAREALYAADMNLAKFALEHGAIGRAMASLSAHVPASGQTDSRGFEWRLLQRLCSSHAHETIAAHAGGVTAFTLSGDGRTLYSVGLDRTLRAWSLDDLREVKSWPMEMPAPYSMARHPSRPLLALAGGNHGDVGLFDLATGTLRLGRMPNNYQATFSPDGQQLLVGVAARDNATNGWIEVLDLELGPLRTLDSAGSRLAFSPDGRLLVTGPWYSQGKFWTWPGLEALTELPRGNYYMSLEFSPDGRSLAAGGYWGGLEIWDTVQRASKARVELHVTFDQLAWSPDGGRIATTFHQKVALFAAAGLQLQERFIGHEKTVVAVRWTPDGQRVISASADGTIRFWPANPGPAAEPVRDVASQPVFSPDSHWMAARSRDGSIGVWHTSSNALLGRLPADVSQLAFTGEGELLVFSAASSNSSGPTVARWQLPSLQPVGSVTLKGYFAGEVTTFGTTGKILAGSGQNGEVLIWDVASGELRRTLIGLTNSPLTQIVIAPDARHVAAVNRASLVSIWPLATPHALPRLIEHSNVTALAFSRDGRYLATGGQDGRTRVFAAESAQLAFELPGHEDAIEGLAVSSDDRTLLTRSQSQVLRFWKLDSQREALVIRGGAGGPFALPSLRGNPVFRPDGEALALTSADGDLILWAAPNAVSRRAVAQLPK